MRPFEYRRAADPATAVDTVVAHPEAVYLGGGTNLVDHMRLGIVEPRLLVDVSDVTSDRIEETGSGGVRIGAGVRNSDLAASDLIRPRYPMLARALLAGASPQLRNAATTGGNLLQRTRCPYFQDVTTPCNKREPGSGCSAIGGYDREQAILGASQHCIAVHPSDMAVAMMALDAVAVVYASDGERRIPLDDLYRLPGSEPHRDTVLEQGDLITGVELPYRPLARHSTYRKVRERASYAFALVSVAAALELSDDRTVSDVLLAFGGVAHKPWRASRAEHALRGEPATEESFRAAADAELSLAQPRDGNAYKVAMLRNTVVAVLRGLAEEET
ncbi:MAG TPA: xanthine dehydrogenase family protein subunit M [Nocardioidaceae bacterium]|nr:xanthine dehydrogenase family protein subunit M [Nocardioidaceae bacterium]